METIFVNNQNLNEKTALSSLREQHVNKVMPGYKNKSPIYLSCHPVRHPSQLNGHGIVTCFDKSSA